MWANTNEFVYFPGTVGLTLLIKCVRPRVYRLIHSWSSSLLIHVQRTSCKCVYSSSNIYYSEDLVVTNGATQGLYMLTSLLFSPGDLVFVEDPTYFVALKILRDDIGLQCVPGTYNIH